MMAGGTVFSRRLSAIFRPRGPLYLRRLQPCVKYVVLVQYMSATQAPFAEFAIERSGALDTPAAGGASAHRVKQFRR